MSRRKRQEPNATKPAPAISRRRFVSLLAAGSAAVLTTPAAGAPAPRRKPAPQPVAPSAVPLSAAQKEFERQRANTLSALKTIRAYPLPPGGDLPVVFRPLPGPRRSR